MTSRASPRTVGVLEYELERLLCDRHPVVSAGGLGQSIDVEIVGREWNPRQQPGHRIDGGAANLGGERATVPCISQDPLSAIGIGAVAPHAVRVGERGDVLPEPVAQLVPALT